MKLKQIKQFGYYHKQNDHDIIYEVIPNNGYDSKEQPVEVIVWNYQQDTNSPRYYYEGGTITPDNIELGETNVVKCTTQVRRIFKNGEHYLQEQKMSNDEKVQKIYEICDKASTKSTFVGGPEIKDAQKLALRILKVLQDC